MKVAIYSPYLDTFGGGERYMMTIAEVFSQNSFDTDVLLDEHLTNIGTDRLKSELSKRFGLELNKISFIKAPVGEGSNFFQRLFFLKKYDLLFYLTDGSIFYPTSKTNILHIQSPLVGQPAKSLWGKVKLKVWNLIIYNSEFTKNNSKKKWPLSSLVIYPPVDIDKIKPLKKKNYILSVGRFFGYLKDKKHDVMIRTFKDLYKDKKIDGWSLNLAGAASEGDESYLRKLRSLSEGFPVNFYPNLGYSHLLKLYGQSSIYWHAAGFDENDPTKMEHFGITTVEAMAGGCVPVVIGKGGQTEIVEHGKSGFLWNNLDELESLTLRLINKDDLWKDLSNKAKIRARVFSKEKFAERIIQLI